MAIRDVQTERSAAQRDVAVVPRLQSGDHLTRNEFERRYATMPEIKKAELIEEVVYVGSPVRQDLHSRPHAALMDRSFVERLGTARA